MPCRRRFLKTGLAGAGLLVTSPRLTLAREAARPAVKSGTDAVTLGRTGVTTSFLAFGTGMNGGAARPTSPVSGRPSSPASCATASTKASASSTWPISTAPTPSCGRR